jgi:hypothetical protein
VRLLETQRSKRGFTSGKMSGKESTMIELTEKQREELVAEVPRVVDPQTKKTYVLVSEEVYERLKALLVPSRVPLPEQRAILHAAGLRAGWDDPAMNVYDHEEDSLKQP